MPLDNPIPAGEPQGTAASAPTPTPASTSWLDSMPEDLRGSQSLTKFKDVEALARGYVNAEQFIGRDKIPMPKTDAEYMDVYRRLGMPENVDGYTFNPKDFEQYGQGALDDLTAFKAMALNAGLTDAQAKKLFNSYIANVSSRLTDANVEFEMAKQNARTELMKRYGQAYESNMQKANRTLTYLANPQLIDAITNSGLGNNPDFIDMMVQISKHYVEEQGIDKSMGNQMSVNQLNEELNKLMANPAYFDGSHPEHNLVVQKAQGIFEQLAQAGR